MSAKALLLGLPSTGKSTFLVALYHLLESGEVVSSLTLERLSEDRGYINEKRARWLGYHETQRTSYENEVEIEMALGAGGQELLLHLPDLAGERFERLLTDRQWPEKLGDDVRTCDGFLLFVHPREVKKPIGIHHLQAEIDTLHEATEEEQTAPFSYEKTPTQVLLVDLLQLLHHARGGEPFKLALIISAYDLITNPRLILADEPIALSPAEWLRETMPLLAQYLNSTLGGDLRIYGVSAQGGNLTNAEDKVRLKNTLNASERVWVLEGERKHADLSAPIRWLFKLDG
jgi:hypothetical protein